VGWILFVAGFGPIVRDTGESRKLYGEVLGIAFKEESDSYLHTEALQGAKTFALWPLSQAALDVTCALHRISLLLCSLPRFRPTQSRIIHPNGKSRLSASTLRAATR
jgi:hypothetical protein